MALVVASGPARSRMDDDMWWAGTLTAIDSFLRPSSQPLDRSVLGRMSVTGPGQNASASRLARRSGRATSHADSALFASTGRFNPDGRRFASNALAVAAASSGRQAIP